MIQWFGASDVVARADSPENLAPEERKRYLQFWRKFRILDNLGWLGLGIVLLRALVGARVHSSFWQCFGIAGLALWLVTGAWLRMLACPRCGVEYCGGLLRLLNPFDLNNGILQMKCFGCDLSRRELSALSEHRSDEC